NGKYVLTSGRGAEFTASGDEPMMREPFLAIAELDGAGTDSRIRAAAPLTLDTLMQVCAERIRIEEDVAWDEAAASVRARRRVMLDAIQLEESPLASPDPERVREALLTGIAASG